MIYIPEKHQNSKYQIIKKMVIIYYWKAMVWFIIITLLSILSSDKLPDMQMKYEHTDKIAHFIM